MKVYSKLDQIPNGTMQGGLSDGCLVLEGGAWRGVYTQGVLDVMMEHGINLNTVIGVSAGAMSGVSYVSGQIGRSARFNLTYRNNPSYCGYRALKDEHAITGFSFFFDEIEKNEPINHEIFDDPKRSFVAVATDIETGKPVYFEKNDGVDMRKAVQASATVPYASIPIEIDGHLYLDGGISCKIPIQWALDRDFDKIVLIRTRDSSYRKKFKKPVSLIDVQYRKYPHLQHQLRNEVPQYNLLLDRIDELEKQGRIFVIAPSEEVTIARFEKDVEKIGDLYLLGRKDGYDRLEALKQYLGK